MEITRVDPADARARRRFIELPFALYRGEPRWVPSLRGETASLLARRHPFFAHSEAEFLLAERGGETLGRVAVLEHRPYNAHHGANRAFLTFFDCAPDAEAAALLLDAAADWARARGLSSLYGPKGFTRSAGVGLLVEGFEHEPATGVPWNPPWLPPLLEARGFVKVTDYLSGYFDRSTRGDERLYRVADIARKRGGFEVKSFRNRRELRRLLPAVKLIQHEAFADNPNYVPSSDAEFALMARDLVFLADLSVLRFILKEGELAGFMGAYPNIGAGLRKAGGRLFPLGWLHVLRARARSSTLDLNGVGILPRFQKQGGDAILFTEVERLVRASRYERADFVQVDERNFLSKSGIEHFSIRWAKRHRVYERAL